MLRITLLEDDSQQTELMMSYLHHYEQDNPDFNFQIRSFDRAMNLLDNYHCDADILLLDIELPDMSGMEAARRIRATDSKVIIMFITNLSQYAMEGYEVHAFDYILKPVMYEAFAAKLQLAIRMQMHRDQGQWITLKSRDGADRVRTEDIFYVEVSAHDLMVHTRKKVIRQWGTLAAFEESLDGLNFVRCNVSYLVNLRYVSAVHGAYVHVGPDKLPISKSKRKDFLTALAQYQGGLR